MSIDVEIRVATGNDDIEAAGALTAEAYHADGLIDDRGEYADELTDAARRAREATLLVAVVPPGVAPGVDPTHPSQAALVGTVTLAPAGTSYAEIAEPGELEVRMLAVAPEARRRGIAEELTRATMLEAVRLDARRVVLSTLDAMTSAHRLYERLGFVRAPERDWHHDGVALRVYTWEPPHGPGTRVETAMWRPREVRGVGGWQVGLSGGFTRRANSVVALGEPDDVLASIAEVERIYAEQGLPAIFRVCAQASPEDLDDLLRERGYRDVAHTLVMVRDRLDEPVPDLPGDADDVAQVSYAAAHEPDDAWLAAWLAVRSDHPVDRALAAGVLGGVRAIYVTAREAGTTVGGVRAALVHEWVGLSCLTVHLDARRRGIARGLTVEALRLAASGGARHAYVQVEESNEPAMALYWQLGFTPAERYHYRQR